MRSIRNLGRAIASGALISMGSADGGEFEVREERIVLEGGIVGIVAQPDGVSNAPAVLMLHGFASHKDEVGDLYKRLAVRLAKRGMGSLRIDFPGWGESDGEMWESSLTVRVAATETAYAYLSGLVSVDSARIGVLGFSMGGTTARISAADHPDWYKTMVAWSSASIGRGLMLTPDKREALERDGRVTLDLGWREVTLGPQWFEDAELYSWKQLDLIAKYPGPFLAIGGGKDPAAKDIRAFVNAAGGTLKEGFIIGCEGHIFEVLTDDQSKAERVLEKTIDWFVRRL